MPQLSSGYRGNSPPWRWKLTAKIALLGLAHGSTSWLCMDSWHMAARRAASESEAFVVKALSGWNRSHPQAISMAIVRLSPWPAFVIPSSRRACPLGCGLGVSPARAPTCFAVRRSRQAKHAIPESHALLRPIPRSVCNWRTGSTAGALLGRRSARRSASKAAICSVRMPTFCPSRSSRARRAGGSGVPSHGCRSAH
jgi:hypothetical protein